MGKPSMVAIPDNLARFEEYITGQSKVVTRVAIDSLSCH